MFHPSWKRCGHSEAEVVGGDIEGIALRSPSKVFA